MATNYPGPYELRIYYVVTVTGLALPHVARYNINCWDDDITPGTPFDEIQVYRNVARLDPDEDLLDYMVDEWIALLQPVFNSSSVTFQRAELWKVTPLSFEMSFISAYDIGVAGSSAVAVAAASQVILTFRTLEGNVMKLAFMESVTQPASATAAAAQAGSWGAIIAYASGDDAWFIGRDTARVFAAMNFNPGQNEKTFKQRYRQLS